MDARVRDREATGVQAFDEGGNPHAGAILTVDLDAIAANYRLLSRRLGTAECAAVLKADAYGLGAARVAPVLSAAGCRTFFVAHLDEGIALRRHVPREAAVWILHGAPRGAEAECLAHGLVRSSTRRVSSRAGPRWPGRAPASYRGCCRSIPA